jgi:hypothetical protein
LTGNQKMLPANKPRPLSALDAPDDGDLSPELFEFESTYDGKVWILDNPIPASFVTVRDYEIPKSCRELYLHSYILA